MPIKINRIKVNKLHGYQNINIPIKDNKLVLVGANGLGKTTVLNLLYYFLTSQWEKLSEYDFSDINVSINNKYSKVSQDNVVISNQQMENSKGYGFAPTKYKYLYREIQTHPEFRNAIKGERVNSALVHRIAETFNFPVRDIVHAINRYSHGRHHPKFVEQNVEHLADVEALLQNSLDGKILYLPTYRRIEKDLGTIFHKLDKEVDTYHKKSKEGSLSLELVEFGMRDVEELIFEVLNEFREKARRELNTLMGSYLRDIIRYEADSYDEKIIMNLDEYDISTILNRIEEKTLDETDKSKLRKVIKKIKSRKTNLDERDKYLAHFFSKLIEIYTAQRMKEEPVRRFVNVCNKYLYKKQIYFDDINYTLHIIDDRQYPIRMGMLSSGEKQIVSLFSHLYLSETNSYYVIIDEPELSLSVEWQKTFLPDIIASNKCAFLAAVTHSPFIFENELEDYTIDIEDFIQ